MQYTGHCSNSLQLAWCYDYVKFLMGIGAGALNTCLPLYLKSDEQLRLKQRLRLHRLVMGTSNPMVRRIKVLQTINVTNLELAWKSAIPKIKYLLEAFRDPVLTCFEFVSRRFLAF